MWNLEQTLEETEEYDNTSIRDRRLVVIMHKPKGRFKGLQISANENEVSTELPEKDREIQTYITLVGCSLSLFALVITVLLFITISQAVAALSSTGACLYMALGLHYSLLATFSWMALEGFHLYLLLVRVFNIYIRRYLLKLSVVGWGVPAVIVSLVVIIDRDAYGHVHLDSDNSTTSTTIMRILEKAPSKKEGPYGQSDCDRAKKDICTLLGVTVLLGITWGLVFFSFGYLTIPGLYLFCILNSLQGFFIFLWFVMSLRKKENSSSKTSSDARSTNS
ncbi:Adhesion G-protein coupled receptor G2 [Nibea albiflora]|uniref:Adhesion G-protein coupled receptor G2 n=1 Tax=Nibea albiflora TaxID=240163 RepID=A0ACB7EHC2_NIBAL|nr:Adhesion G-protein coupled receptor G2 [Nibea albiflora]